jgi:DNA repair protein RAD5
LQFTGFLDLIERVMNRERFSSVDLLRSLFFAEAARADLFPSIHSYVRLDGAMSQKARQKVVHKFTNSDNSCIMLASLKAGGVGLNLIAATHVYLMDAWWNSKSSLRRRASRADQPSALPPSFAASPARSNVISGAVENQAIDRIHRFGQTREVYVTRFLVDKSIDDKMIAVRRLLPPCSRKESR